MGYQTLVQYFMRNLRVCRIHREVPRDGADMKYRAQEKMVQTLVQYFIRNKSRPEQTCDKTCDKTCEGWV